MYALNFYSEITEMRQQYANNKFAVFYFSKALSNCQLFIEFIYEILNEQSEPLVIVIEGIKCLLKLREYRQLINKEHINAYIELEAYKELKKLKEIKASHYHWVRARNRLPRDAES